MAGRDAAGVVDYARHRPEETLLYQLVEEHYPTFAGLREAQGRPLPAYVQREFEDFLKCGRLEHGFLRVRCERCHDEKLVAFSCKRRGFCPSCGARRMVESAALPTACSVTAALCDQRISGREHPDPRWAGRPSAIRRGPINLAETTESGDDAA